MNKKMEKAKIGVLVAGVVLVAVLLVLRYQYISFLSSQVVTETPKNVLHLPSGDVSLLVSDTDASRTQGLSGTNPLPANQAMIFVFKTADKYGFWMKDMNYNLDIIWLDADHRIVYIAPDLAPSTYPQIFIPPQKSLYVLEADVGFSQKNNLKVGDVLDFSLATL